MLTVSAHKIYGPAGIGALFIRSGTQIDPLLWGGAQESNRRAGTENSFGIAGFGAALELLGESLAFQKQARQLQDTFENQIKSALADCTVIGEQTSRLPYISLLSFPGISND
ncbi:cysteine desulfurase NifS, partial [candidate division KSB1 bacterium]